MRLVVLSLLFSMSIAVGCRDEIPEPAGDLPSQSAPQADVHIAQERSSNALQRESEEQPSTIRVSQPQAAPVDLPAQTATDAEPQGHLYETAIEMNVPTRIGSVELFALPYIDWPVLAIRHPSQSISILALAPLLPGDKESGWLLAEVPDGTRGWITAESLRLGFAELAHLPRLDRPAAVAHATTRRGAFIQRTPDSDEHCVVPEGTEVEVAGRSRDGRWFYTQPRDQSCEDSNGNRMWRGWIPTSDLEYDPLLDRAPVIHSYGLWMVSTVPRVHPERLPIAVRDSWESESWSFDPDDQSIVFWSFDETGTAKLRRYTTEVRDLSDLPHGPGDILVAPTGGRVLVMAGIHSELSGVGVEPTYKLTIVEPDGRTTDIGEAFLYCQCSRGRFLSAQASWSPDGRTVVFRDWGIPEQAEPGHDAGEFWLYSLDTGERVELVAEDPRWLSISGPAVFHPDGQSLYVRVLSAVHRSNHMLRRLSLEGEDWPGFRSAPVDGGVRVSPNGQWLIAMTNGVLLILTEQGELRSARSGLHARWLPDSKRFVYLQNGRTLIGHIGRERPVEVHPTGHSPWMVRQLSPDGEHLATDSSLSEWSYQSWADVNVVQIYSADGRLRSTFRYTGCSQQRWSPDSSRLAVSARSNCSAP